MAVAIPVAIAVSAIVDDRARFYPNWFYFIVEVVAAAALFATSVSGTQPA